MKKIICLAVLAAVFALSVCATDIGTADELLTLMNTPDMWTGEYTLTGDIDLSTATNGLAQTPIGTKDSPFTGTFDGAGYEISNISITGDQYVALFGYINGATIKNLTISGTITASGYYSGGLIAYAATEMYVSRCHNKCNVNAAKEYTGGICGYATGADKSTTTAKMNITECMNSGTITCLDPTQSDAGGIAGSIYGVGNVSDCFNEGLVTTGGVSLDKPYIAGIAGKTGSYGRVTNCYNITAPETPSEATTYVRAIVGRPNVKNGANNFFKDGLGMSDKNYGSVYSADKFDTLNANGLWVNADDPRLAYFYVAPEVPEEPEVPEVPEEPEIPDVTLDAEISTADQLLTLMNYPHLWAADYTLANDIDLSTATNGLSQKPIGSEETPYSGVFDGAGYEISGINIVGEKYVALFGYATDATIKNLTVSGSVTASGDYSGGIVAYGFGPITIEKCHNKCTVTGIEYIAGIVGYLKGSDSVSKSEPETIVSECMNSGTVICLDPIQCDAGGIVGSAWNVGAIRNCLNAGLITTGDVAPEKPYIGGIVGKTHSFAHIYNCYNAVAPTAAVTSTYVRGIVGYPQAKNARNNFFGAGLGMSDTSCGKEYSPAEFSLLNVYGVWVDKENPKLAAFYECNHAETEYKVITPSTCTEKGSAKEICTVCFAELGTAALPLDDNAHANFVWTSDDTYSCSDCDSEVALSGDYMVTPYSVVTADGKITLTLLVETNEPVLALGFSVIAEDGVNFVSVASSLTNGDFAFVGSADRMAIISTSGAAPISAIVTLVYEAEGAENGDTIMFDIDVLEAYDEDGAVEFIATDALVTYSAMLAGDVNGNGEVGIEDVMIILSAVANGRFVANADINGDGVINLIDALKVLKLMVA